MLARRTPLRQTSALKRKRKPSLPAAEKAHLAHIHEMPCLVCGVLPVTAHHVTSTIQGGRLRRSDQRIVPLCRMHHQTVWDPKASAPVSVEGLGHRGFYLTHGIDLFAVAERLWSEHNGGQ